jgi:hypothetical protein
MLLRIRSQVGQWRLHDVEPGTTIAEVRARISKEHNVDLSDNEAQPLTLGPNPAGKGGVGWDGSVAELAELIC